MTEEQFKKIFEVGEYNGKTWLPGIGRPPAKLMIIISYPSKDDVKELRLLSGGSGIEIDNALEIAGFQLNDIYITSMVKFGIGNIVKPTTTQIQECAEMLDLEIKLCQPKLIMTLGSEPFKAVMKQNLKQTDFIGEIIDSPYGKLLPNYSPGMILVQDPKQRPFFRECFELAKRFLDDKLNYTKFSHIVVEDPAVNKALVQHYIDTKQFSIGYDAEWKGKKYTDDEVMYTFQYCCEPNKAIILHISKDGKTENRELLDTMKPLLEHPEADRLGWNIRADDKRLKLRGFNIPEHTLGCDGMKLVGFIDSRWGKGLETGIRKFTNYAPYYNDLNTEKKAAKLANSDMSDVMFSASDTFFNYCAGDAVSHREACINMRNHFKSKFPKGQQDYYFNTYLPLSNYFLDLESSGIPIDMDVMARITTMYTAKYNELKDRLTALTKPYKFDSATKAAVELVNLDEAATYQDDFNPGSVKDKRALLYDILKLTPHYYIKDRKTKPREWYLKQKPNVQKQCSPSTNGKSIATLKFHLEEQLLQTPNDQAIKDTFNIIKTLLELTRVSVFANKFFNPKGTDFSTEEDPEDEEEPLKSSYWAAVCKDGKIHPDFYECLANFRSSSTPNVQNPASKVLSHIPEIFVPGYTKMSKEDKKKHDHLIPPNPRHIFYGGGGPWKWAEVDVAGADLAIAAFCSGDPDYINDILRGNFHVHKMREYFQDDKLSKDDLSSYVTAKSITFRVAYTSDLLSAAIPIQAEIYAESGIYVDIHKIEFALTTWRRYEKYMEFRDKCTNQVDEKHYIENLKGIRYYFEDTENFSILAGWKNESLAYPIASELALFLWDVSVAIKKELQKTNVWMKFCKPVNSVHDASYWLVHDDIMKDNYFPEVCKHYFTKQCKITTGDNLGMEMVVADRWKGKEKSFSKETAWNFDKKCWDWKE